VRQEFLRGPAPQKEEHRSRGADIGGSDVDLNRERLSLRHHKISGFVPVL